MLDKDPCITFVICRVVKGLGKNKICKSVGGLPETTVSRNPIALRFNRLFNLQNK